MDEIDLKILAAYQGDPLQSISDLADKIGLSHTPCWRRLKRLQQEGYVQHVAGILNPEKLGYDVNIIVHVKIEKHDEATLDAFEKAVRMRPEILECFSMSGESDYLLRVVAKSIKDYERFLKQHLSHLPGITSLNSSFAMKSVKLTTDLPI